MALLHPILEWRVGLRWYAFALGFIALIKVLSALLHRLITGGGLGSATNPGSSSWEQPSSPRSSRPAKKSAGAAMPFPGWRRSLDMPAPVSSWESYGAMWHLPFFFIQGVDKQEQSLIVYLLQVIALSVAMTWLYVRTKGSLLLMMLMHSAVNQTKGIVPSVLAGATNPFTLNASLVAWLTVALLWMCGAYFLYSMDPGDGVALS